ncbi:MAG: protoporphyrinogen oxidase [Thermomicrobiales bacterium]
MRGHTIAVVGGGVSGLAAAWRIVQRDPATRVIVFEASDRLGGKLHSVQADGFLMEAGPDAFLSAKPRGIGLARELGLDSQFQSPDPATRGSFVLRRGTLHPLPEGLTGLIPTRLKPMAQTSLISPLGKARMAMDFVIPARSDDADESLHAFLSRRLGREPFENLIEPLMAGIYAGDAKQLSLEATFPQLRKAEREHGGVIKGVIAARRQADAAKVANPNAVPAPPPFTSFTAGTETLIRALDTRLRAVGVEMRLSAPVTAVHPAVLRDGRPRWRVIVGGGASEAVVDGVIFASPAWATAPILSTLDADAGAALGAIPHVSTALIMLGFPLSQVPDPKRLHGHGYVVPRTEGRTIMAMSWLSSKWRNRAPEGMALLRGFAGRAGQEAVFARSDDELILAMRNEVRDVLGFTVDPSLAQVFRYPNAMPQYTLGHLDRVRRVEDGIARLPGIEIAGNALRGVGIPDAILAGEKAADALCKHRTDTGSVPTYALT